MDLTILNPGYDVQCKQCTKVGPGVILRKVGDPRNFSAVCGRCLTLALQEVTKMKWQSQYEMWLATRKIGNEVRKERYRAR